MDISWSPTHVSMFACLDASGCLVLYNLNEDAEVPIATVPIAIAGGNKISWDREGKNISIGGSDGCVQVYSLGDCFADAEKMFC